jgi:hypothetical protein
MFAQPEYKRESFNGDPFVPNARALEPLFKTRMFAEVQA